MLIGYIVAQRTIAAIKDVAQVFSKDIKFVPTN